MTPDQRTKLLLRLYLFGPELSLVLCSPIFFIGLAPMLPKTLPFSARNLLNIAFNLAPVGWGLLTLGCSAGTAWDRLRRQGKMGKTLAIYMLLATPLIALAHLLVIGTVVFAGCMILLKD